ncbi:MAG: Stp1/IreP family PP2C-type Ser/Thr phosphatase [Clostridiaceae bacterium]
MIEWISDIGNMRSLNEDTIGIYEDLKYNLFIVCDGMGGHNAGEIASLLAKDTIINSIEKSFDEHNPVTSLELAVNQANDEVFALSQTDIHLEGMGTTVTAALSFQGKLYVAHVGDSSLFYISDHRIRKVTKDHSLVQELVDSGNLDQEDAKHHPNKNIITRAVGTKNKVIVDTFVMDTTKEDIFILCTDGLTDTISDEEILTVIIGEEDKKKAVVELKDLAIERGGKDNITLVIFGGEALK